jgi:predicted nucleotide-binding protein
MTESKNVFIVHGRDDGIKETVARFVSDLGYVPIILHEQPSGGKTVIEKFEANADVCFVIALMTPDDMGGLSGKKQLKPRARQNVIFEFGYFIGRLSRKRVCALTKGDVEIPSDYAGVVYIPMDSAGAWRMLLLREMKAAGLSVDANKVI